MPVAAIPLITTVASAAISAGQQSKARKQAASAQTAEQQRRDEIASKIETLPEGFEPEDVFGKRPELKDVPYNSLSVSDPGFKKNVAQLLKANLGNLPAAQQLFEQISAGITGTMKKRATMFDPNFLTTLSQLGSNAALASRGRLPMEDARGIVANQAEFGSLLGTPGGRRPQIARDLGMTRTQLATQTGPNLLSQVANIFNAVDPLQSHMAASPTNFLLNPSQTVPIAVQENQFGTGYDRSQADQAMYLDAMADPVAAGMFNLNRQALGYQSAPLYNQTPAAAQGYATQGGGGAQIAQAFLGALPGLFGGMQGGAPVAQSSPVSAPIPINQSAPIFNGGGAGGGMFSNLLNGIPAYFG